jgi:hypothetical protein
MQAIYNLLFLFVYDNTDAPFQTTSNADESIMVSGFLDYTFFFCSSLIEDSYFMVQ